MGGKTISKKLRFEIFKRDSFKCQYCGATAPETILQIDHIKPKSKGGTNEITNLITCCFDCNSGKKDRELSDNAVIEKQYAQLDELQQRREQIEMLYEWSASLKNIENETVEKLVNYWNVQINNKDENKKWELNEVGKDYIRKLLKKFPINEIIEAMNTSIDGYLKRDDENNLTKDSMINAFNKIAGICRVNRLSQKDPDIKELYYIRGIARNRCDYFNNWKAIELLKIARKQNISIDELREIACTSNSWTQFKNRIEDTIINLQDNQ